MQVIKNVSLYHLLMWRGCSGKTAVNFANAEKTGLSQHLLSEYHVRYIVLFRLCFGCGYLFNVVLCVYSAKEAASVANSVCHPSGPTSASLSAGSSKGENSLSGYEIIFTMHPSPLRRGAGG